MLNLYNGGLTKKEFVFMRKKIILGIVILIVLAAAIVGAVYFNKNYAIVEKYHGTKRIVGIDVARILFKDYDNWDDTVKCTPSLKKLTKLEKLRLIAEEDMDLNYLSEMKDLNELTIFYYDNYNECTVKFETMPDLPNLKELWLVDFKIKGYNTNFTLPDDVEYNFDSIEKLVIDGNQILDFECLKHFKNLKVLEIGFDKKGLTEEQIEELESRGITVEFN